MPSDLKWTCSSQADIKVGPRQFQHVYAVGHWHLVTTTTVQLKEDNPIIPQSLIPLVKMLHFMRGDDWPEEIQIVSKLTEI